MTKENNNNNIAAQRTRQRQLLPPLLLLLFLLLQHKAQEANATPLQRRHASNSDGDGCSDSKSNIVDPCAHKSIAELIRTSPVIVKALGARIFSDDDDDDIVNLLPAATGARAGARARLQMAGSKSATQTVTMSSTTASSAAAILITLTPETIYKGASLLKMTPGHGEGEGGGGSGGGGVAQSGGNINGNADATSAANAAARGNSVESAYQYEGQLNATLEPLGCFDANMLKMLPMELIAFGNLLPATQQQQQQGRQQQLQQQQQSSVGVGDGGGGGGMSNSASSMEKDILHISINGLHRWTPQFEHHIWKHLGWDDWSDFTLCSVTCGKGVQQRFRRCLLDNPMVNMNMNMNLNDIDDDVDDDDDALTDDVNGDGDDAEDEHIVSAHVEVNSDDVVTDNKVSTTTELTNDAAAAADDDVDDVDNTLHKFAHAQSFAHVLSTSTHVVLPAADVTAANAGNRLPPSVVANSSKPSGAQSESIDSDGAGAGDGDKNNDVNEHKSVAFVQHDRAHNSHVANVADAAATSADDNDAIGYVLNSNRASYMKKRAQHKKKHKSAKSLSTLFCEGYNIEQRNCNTFECSDDINDLLKFYKKLPMTADELAASAPLSSYPPFSPSSSSSASSSASSITTVAIENDFGATSTVDLSAANVMQQQPSSTPSNMGYIRNWRNSLNFTLMITLRAKNDTNNTATIFSIRNSTHNLYLEACKDGLRLYLERDNTTEMLPVKFNLYDYRWHQVAISIQNGDFISIYVDCLWTNSFVVSKRLFSLPLDADVEIGRGFNGELQQLLVLPEHEERHQCSNKRTSINEVKRYIIDTFIDDYAN